MTSKTFVSGTVIDSVWLNDVNTHVYGPIAPDGTLRGDLAASSGASLVGYDSGNPSALITTVQTKLREVKSIEDFRILSDPDPLAYDDTALVQRAFNAGVPIKFTQDYRVDSVSASTIGGYIDFNGYRLIGMRPAGGVDAQFVLTITGRQMTFYDVYVTANLNGYTSCIRWQSVDAGNPAQNNTVYGMKLFHCGIGLIYGQEVGTPAVDAAQSENTIYGFYSRGLQTPIVGNQPNGFLTLVSPLLDCNPNEWATQPGYNATTWNTAATIINNVMGQIVTIGGELLKTASQLGYGFKGGGIVLNTPVLEIACTMGYLTGEFEILNNTGGYMSSDSLPVFVIDAAATGALRLINTRFIRGPGVGSYAAVNFFSYLSATNNFDIFIDGGAFFEWKPEFIVDRTTHVRDVSVTPTAGAAVQYLNDNDNCLLKSRGVDTNCYSLTGWTGNTLYDATTLTIATDGPANRLPASIKLDTAGAAFIYAGDNTSAATVKSSAIRVMPGELWRFDVYAKRTAGLFSLQVRYYDINGAFLTNRACPDIVTTTWAAYYSYQLIPANTAYMLIAAYAEVSVGSLADLRVIRLGRAS